MAIRTDITVAFSTSPRIATIASPSVSVSIQDLHDTLQFIQSKVGNLSFKKLIDSAGKEPLGGGVLVGITSTLQDVKVAFEARPGPTFVQCNISGGNLVAVDLAGADLDPVQTTAFTQVVRTSSSSATLQEQADIQQSSFRGGVIIDAGNITGKAQAGTTYPAGTERQPVLGLVDALVISNSRGIGSLFIEGAFTCGAADVLSGFILKGVSAITTNIITLTAGCTTLNTRFEALTLVGTLNGKVEAVGVVFGAITNMDYDSWILNCWFMGDVTLKGGGSFICIDCGVANNPGATARPNFDYADVPTAKSNFLRWSGNIGFRGVTAGDISLNLDSGKVFLEASNTNGNMVIAPGEADVDDQSGAGFTVTRTLRPSTLVPDAIGAANIATDAIGSLEIGADAVQELVDGIRQQVLTEGYAVNGSEPTLEQMMYMIWSALSEFSIAGTTITQKKLNRVTASMTHAIDDPTNPTSRTRTT